MESLKRQLDNWKVNNYSYPKLDGTKVYRGTSYAIWDLHIKDSAKEQRHLVEEFHENVYELIKEQEIEMIAEVCGYHDICPDMRRYIQQKLIELYEQKNQESEDL